MQNWNVEKGPEKTCHLFFVENIQKNQMLVKLIGQCIPDGNGRGIARDTKKNMFIFKTWQKNGNKVGTVYKVGILLYISDF